VSPAEGDVAGTGRGPETSEGRPPWLLEAQGFRHLGDTVRLRGRRIDVVEAGFTSPEGTSFSREVVRHPGAVAVVPVTASAHVMLVRQYRGALDGALLEVPAGTRDVEGEAPELTAARELEEEVGVRARSLVLMTAMVNSPGFSDQVTHLYLASDLEAVPQRRSGEEELHMDVVELPLADAVAMVERGDIVDAQTIIGLLLAERALSRAGE
jgi:ADP-ribose pyrophosphatase